MLMRSFNARGMERFREFLGSYQSGSVPPEAVQTLVRDTNLSDLVEPRVQIDLPRLASKRELAAIVCEAFERSDYQELPIRASARDRGMWTWMAASAFHLIRPAGRRVLHDYAYYVMSERTFRFYKHRIAGPARNYWLYGHAINTARVLFYGNLFSVSEFEDRLTGNSRIFSNQSLIAVANKLYYDFGAARPKRGSQNQTQGALRRFVVVTGQLDRTYDLHGMSVDQILDLLPPEFDRWKNN